MDGDSSLTHGVVSFGPFHLFAAERQVKKGEEPLQLGGRAFETLIALVERAGEVVTQRELVSRVWPDLTVVTSGPILATTPAMSLPGICGSENGTPGIPWRTQRSR